MRITTIVLLLLCPISNTFAGQVRGRVPASEHESKYVFPNDDHFWRLGAQNTQLPPLHPTIVTLEPLEKGNQSQLETKEDNRMVINGYRFSPPIKTISANGSILFDNQDQKSYSCYTEGPNSFQFSDLKPGMTYEQKFLSEDMLEIRCHLYPFMTAFIVVSSNSSLVAQTDQQGRFGFQRVKPGKYQVRVYTNGSRKWESEVQVPMYGAVEVDFNSTESVKESLTAKPSPPRIEKAVEPQEKPKRPLPKETQKASNIVQPTKNIQKPQPKEIATQKRKKNRNSQPSEKTIKTELNEEDPTSEPTPVKKMDKRKPQQKESPATDFQGPTFDNVEPEIEIEEE